MGIDPWPGQVEAALGELQEIDHGHRLVENGVRPTANPTELGKLDPGHRD
ncbi:MAG TPA: hypothetical protein VGW34_05840 [Allosphingosinicella sp.]|nr:hypothetical protein [Allosphingosinicella sp.]